MAALETARAAEEQARVAAEEARLEAARAKRDADRAADSAKLMAGNSMRETAEMDALKKLVPENLKDPDSAQFRNMRTEAGKDGRYVCGEVNSKNSFGGYVGFKGFVITAVGTGNQEMFLTGDGVRGAKVLALCS